MEGKNRIGRFSWVAEYEIPLSQLRYSNKDEQCGNACLALDIATPGRERLGIQSKTGPGVLLTL